MGILNIMDIDRNRNGRDSLVEYITLKYTHLDQFLYSENDINTDVNEENEEVKPEWLDLISAIGPRLKLCRIKLATKNPQIITSSASLSTQLKDLGIYDHYPPSSVYRIVPEPLLKNVTSLSLDSMYGGFELLGLKALTQLKELKLDSKYRMTISLNSIVANIPKGANSLSLKTQR
jgi:hypothetical protein